ncbi:hypothetical protein [Marinobacter mangrovi]|uniref:hypothetical protein n=1 Tax=Marinobacter mangrovi TaxID=2803918 RepID=UPI0019332B0B|nr:hypothetical protein [Marinobacter mangrovi]
MNKWILLIVFGTLSAVSNASVITYDIKNYITDLDNGNTFTGAMQAVFDDDADTLLSCSIELNSKTWIFASEMGEPVTVESNEISSNVYEIFMLFGPIWLVNELDEISFYANEWKILDKQPDTDPFRLLGEKGPSGMGLINAGSKRYGITSEFSHLSVSEVSEPGSGFLCFAGLALMFFIKVRRRFI